jgi:hypothetical protein
MGFSGCLVTVMPSSSVTPMKKRRQMRMIASTPKLCHLLLETRPVECKMIVVALEMRPICLRLPCQKGCL